MEMLLLLFVCMFGVARVQGSDDDATGKKFAQTIDRLLSMLEDESKRNVLFDLLKTRGRNMERFSQATSNLMGDNGRTPARLRDIAVTGKEQINAEADLMDHDRRNAIQLANMVKHTTGTSPFDYLSYGCYCGLGGKGEPVDELDRCCLTHDRCYGKLTADYGCSEYWRYFNTYGWSIGSNGDIICTSDSNECKEGQCICDKEMAECFQQHHTVYNDRYTGWWWTIWKKSREC